MMYLLMHTDEGATMNVQEIIIGDIQITIPASFAKLNRLPDDPPDMVAYATQTEQSTCMMFLQPIGIEYAMPYDEPQAVINEIHQTLSDDQGLIEVATATTNTGRNTIWSIVKTSSPTACTQYALTMHIDWHSFTLQVQAFANEARVAGIREAQVHEFARRQGWIDSNGHGWSQDPYDAEYHHGALMNISENDQFDNSFPNHPLSVIRRLTATLISHN